MARGRRDAALDEAKVAEIEQEIREEAILWAEEQVLSGAYPGLTPEMLRAIYVMVHPMTGNSVLGWARIADVGRNMYARYRDRDEWKRAVEELRAERRGKQLALADRVIEELTGAGVDPRVRLAAARTIYEREGQFVRRVETTHTELTPAERAARRRMRQRLGGESAPGEERDDRVIQ